MANKKLRIAIISDLHCHPNRKKEEGKNETYLLTDKLRTPANDHPVEHLLQILKKQQIEVDLTLCPGDFTDKANAQGFISGWGFSLEIHRQLSSKDIIATVGNHDVDVYNSNSNYSLDMAKGIKRGFPVEGTIEQDSFWGKGCVFVEKEEYRVLVINSSHYHHNKLSATGGKVGDDLIEYVREYLSKKNDNKINIALSHHHPIDHSELKLGEEDKIINGDSLLNILGEYKFDLFIHGHKHDPLLRYFNTSSSNFRIPIFSSGSFSSSSNLMFTGKKNAFHIIEISKDIVSKGEIQTWTFFPNTGWAMNLDEKGYAPYSGFGNELSVDKIYDNVVGFLAGKTSASWEDLSINVVDINNLIPSDSLILFEKLKENKYIMDSHIWTRPKAIYNLTNH